MIPTHPIIRLQLTQLLMQQYALDSVTAHQEADNLIHAMASADMFIVKGNWMDGKRRTSFAWEDIPAMADEFEDRKPWFPEGYDA